MKTDTKNLYSLIALDDFKGLLGIDDRDDRLARFCLIMATYTIEQLFKRRLLRKKHFERVEYQGDLILPLKEYPVSKVLAVFALQSVGVAGDIVEPEFYSISPDCGTEVNSTITKLYWQVGKMIKSDILKNKRAEYGHETLNNSLLN